MADGGTLTIDLPRKHRDALNSGKRFVVLYGGRDGAKSWSVARYLIARAMVKPERILCTREIQESIAESVYQTLIDQIKALGVESYFEIQAKYIYGKNGSQFSFHGLSGQTITSLKSYEGTTICWIEEAQTVTKRSLSILTPTIRADGSQIIVTFNPDMDTDEVYDRFVTRTPPDAAVSKVNWTDNPWPSKVLNTERDQMKAADPEAYDHIYGGNCRPALEGAIYFNEVSALRSSGRLGVVPYDPMLKAHVIADLGRNDFMALIIAQRRASEIRIVRYIEDRLRHIPSYDAELRGLKYNWGKMWLPHDGRAKSLTSASNPLGASAEEQFTTLGWQVEIVENIDREQGIRKAREVFPRISVDRENATELVNRLGRYRRRINKETRQAGEPMHDDASNGADGFRYLCLVADQISNDVVASPAGFYGAFTRAA